ncbi:proline-rich receptor-like protein kinase PERK1 [Zingiber officinale]|uniref:proline-rich receptor-like protein kinase PERK1 n=1 Tax=Zingiber officinale TaxID=94328 RepID=UPI001C4AAD6B|nr:proline-rich receptor-like protein kinase PERK1 [Zingiber officinale]
MDPRSLTFSFLVPLLALSGQGPTPSPSPSPASSPSPSPSPSTVSPPTARYPPPTRPTEYPPPPGLFATSNQLNVGEKVGLAFLSVVLVLQLALGGFLISKRLQLRNMALVGRRIETPYPAGSP